MAKNKYIVNVSSEIPSDDYFERFITSPQYSPFTSPEWLRFLREGFSGHILMYSVRKGEELIAYQPVWERTRKLVGRIAEIPPITPYWGPVVIASANEKDVKQSIISLAAAITGDYPSARMILHPSINDVRPLLWGGWNAKPMYTSLLSITEPDTYIQSLPSKTRNKIKQCEGMKVVQTDDVSDFAKMHDYTFTRQGMKSPIGTHQLELLTERFKNKYQIYYLLDERDIIIAGRFEILFGDTAYDILAATSESGRGPFGAYLMYEILIDLTRNGYRIDHIGMNTPSIATFKENFRGTLTPYYLMSKQRNPLIESLYRVDRRLFG